MAAIRRSLLAVSLAWGLTPAMADEAALAEQVQAGGYLLYLPHAQAQQTHPAEFREPPECSPSTRLSEPGWREAVQLGIGLRKRGIFAEVAYASPVCASRHTAYLVFGADRVRLDPQLALDCGRSAEAAEHATHLRDVLSREPPYPEVNLAVVAHGCNLKPLTRADWPDCAREPEPGSVVVLRRAGATIRPLGCLSAKTLQAWSRVPEF